MKRKFVKPPDFQLPDLRSLVQLAQTEGGKSEVSCALDYDNPVLVKAVPMMHIDESRPSDFRKFCSHHTYDAVATIGPHPQD